MHVIIINRDQRPECVRAFWSEDRVRSFLVENGFKESSEGSQRWFHYDYSEAGAGAVSVSDAIMWTAEVVEATFDSFSAVTPYGIEKQTKSVDEIMKLL